jgi:hypothetical protein
MSMSMLIVATFALSSDCFRINSSQTLYLGEALSTDLTLVGAAVLNSSSLTDWKRTRLPPLLLLLDRRGGGGGILFRPRWRATGASALWTNRFSLSFSL